jgi:hypothetical protein
VLNVTSAELAVDRDVEQRQVARLLIELKPRADSPHVLLLQWRLRSDQLTLVPRSPFCGRRARDISVLHGYNSSVNEERSMRHTQDLQLAVMVVLGRLTVNPPSSAIYFSDISEVRYSAAIGA